jgi:hypothetical protein
MKLILLIFCFGLSPPLGLEINSEIVTVKLDAPSYALKKKQTTHKEAAIVASCLEQNSNLQI